jgi:hypothetical protein
LVGANIEKADADIISAYAGEAPSGGRRPSVDIQGDANSYKYSGKMNDKDHPVFKMYQSQWSTGGEVNLPEAYRNYIQPEVEKILRSDAFKFSDAEIATWKGSDKTGITNVPDMYRMTGGGSYYSGILAGTAGVTGELSELSMDGLHHQAGNDAWMQYQIYNRMQQGLTDKELVRGRQNIIAGRVLKAAQKRDPNTTEGDVLDKIAGMRKNATQATRISTGPQSGPSASLSQKVSSNFKSLFKQTNEVLGGVSDFGKSLATPGVRNAVKKLPGWNIAAIGGAAIIAGALLADNRAARNKKPGRDGWLSSDRVAMMVALGG